MDLLIFSGCEVRSPYRTGLASAYGQNGKKINVAVDGFVRNIHDIVIWKIFTQVMRYLLW